VHIFHATASGYPIVENPNQAARETFGTSATLVACISFLEAFDALQDHKVEYAIIPFENSTNGSVVQTLDLLADRSGVHPDIEICDEHFLSVHHCLLVGHGHGHGHEHDDEPAQPRSTKQAITKLYTHPQAWGQCESFLSRHFKGVERQDVSSTSKAAEIVSQDHSGTSAAIASKFAAESYGALVLDANIEDNANNATRFLIFRHRASAVSKNTASYPPQRSLAARKDSQEGDHSRKQKCWFPSGSITRLPVLW